MTGTCVLLNRDGSIRGALSADDVAGLRASLAPDDRHADVLSGGGCYFLHNTYTRLVKIGLSHNLRVRWRGLEAHSGVLLEPLAFWSTDDPKQLETSLHERFSAHRTLGEWFADAPVQAWVDTRRSEATMDDLLTVEQVSSMLHASRATIFRLIAEGAIESIKVGRNRHVRRGAVREFVLRMEGAA